MNDDTSIRAELDVVDAICREHSKDMTQRAEDGSCAAGSGLLAPTDRAMVRAVVAQARAIERIGDVLADELPKLREALANAGRGL